MSKRTNMVKLANPVAGYEAQVNLAEIPQPQLQALKSAVLREEHARAIETQERRDAEPTFEPEPDFDDDDFRHSAQTRFATEPYFDDDDFHPGGPDATPGA